MKRSTILLVLILIVLSLTAIVNSQNSLLIAQIVTQRQQAKTIESSGEIWEIIGTYCEVVPVQMPLEAHSQYGFLLYLESTTGFLLFGVTEDASFYQISYGINGYPMYQVPTDRVDVSGCPVDQLKLVEPY